MKLVAGSSNLPLAQSLAHHLGIPILDVELTQFANGEKRVWVKEDIRGENLILVQSLSAPVDEHIMEFLLLADALERLGARHINAVIPWMGYSLQDKVFREGEPIAAKVIANLVSNAYIKRVFLLDLHNSSTTGFFSIPSTHLSAVQLFTQYVKDTIGLDQTVVASPDFGGLKRARMFADQLGLDLANIDKHRNLRTGEVTAVGVHGGTVKGKTVVLFDDCIVSGGTVVEAAAILKEHDAKAVHFCATHAIFAPGAVEKLNQGQLDSIVVTNSIYHQVMPKVAHVLDVGPLFTRAVSKWL